MEDLLQIHLTFEGIVWSCSLLQYHSVSNSLKPAVVCLLVRSFVGQNHLWARRALQPSAGARNKPSGGLFLVKIYQRVSKRAMECLNIGNNCQKVHSTHRKCSTKIDQSSQDLNRIWTKFKLKSLVFFSFKIFCKYDNVFFCNTVPF